MVIDALERVLVWVRVGLAGRVPGLGGGLLGKWHGFRGVSLLGKGSMCVCLKKD